MANHPRLYPLYISGIGTPVDPEKAAIFHSKFKTPSEMHETKQIESHVGAADEGKVITPSMSSPGQGSLEFLSATYITNKTNILTIRIPIGVAATYYTPPSPWGGKGLQCAVAVDGPTDIGSTDTLSFKLGGSSLPSTGDLVVGANLSTGDVKMIDWISAGVTDSLLLTAADQSIAITNDGLSTTASGEMVVQIWLRRNSNSETT